MSFREGGLNPSFEAELIGFVEQAVWSSATAITLVTVRAVTFKIGSLIVKQFRLVEKTIFLPLNMLIN
jgi:hypothetical protein